MLKPKDYHFTLKLSVFFLVLPIAVFFLNGSSYQLIAQLKFFILIASLPLSVLFAAAFIVLKRSRPAYRGLGIAITCVFLSILIMSLGFWAGHRLKYQVHIPHAKRMQCQENMKRIYQAFLVYAEENNGLLPMNDNWCDTLIATNNINPEDLMCPAIQEECKQSNYVLNTSIAGKKLEDSSPETFLLYEDALCDWNQTSVTISITETNHKVAGMDFTNILYVNGKIQNISKDNR